MRTPDLIAIVYFAYVIAAAGRVRDVRARAAAPGGGHGGGRHLPRAAQRADPAGPFRGARLAAGRVAAARLLAAGRPAARADAGRGSVAAGERPVDPGDDLGADAAGLALGGAGTRLFPGPRLRPGGIPRPGHRRIRRVGALLDARPPRRLRLLRHAALAPGAAAAARRTGGPRRGRRSRRRSGRSGAAGARMERAGARSGQREGEHVPQRTRRGRARRRARRASTYFRWPAWCSSPPPC